MNKQAYMKPVIEAVKIQQHIICTSPTGYSGKNLPMNSGDGKQIDDENEVW